MRIMRRVVFWKLTNTNYISHGTRLRLVGETSSVLLGLLLFSILSPISINWTSVEATPGVANPSTTSITLSLVNDTLELDAAPTSSAGTFVASSSASFTVSTDNVTGYTIGIKSDVDATDATEVANATKLVNTSDSTKYFSSISSATSSSTFSNASNTQYNNKWGFLPSKANSSTNTNYLPAPSYDAATVMNATECANGTLNSTCTDNSDTYTIAFGARADYTLPIGTYEHSFVLVALGNPVNYSITYDANDGANGANTTDMPNPNPQTGNTALGASYVTLSSARPKRGDVDGYDLRGWCTVTPITDANHPEDQDCVGAGGTLFQPGAEFGIDQTASVNIINLYATWWYPTLTKMNNKPMKEMFPQVCYNSSIGDTATMTDSRGKVITDNPETTEEPESYSIAKLADGNCWMTKNLNLGGSSNIRLTSDDTDIPEGTTFTLLASSSDYSSSTGAANINTPYNLNNHTIASHTVNNITYTNSVASYYTYAAATASTSTYSAGTGSYVTTSICPKGWHLPKETQYINLRSAGSITTAAIAFGDPYHFTYGGYRSGASSFSNETSYGYYWTSRNSTNSQAYRVYFYSSGMYSSPASMNKYYGLMVRCVADRGTVTINYNANGGTGTIASEEKDIQYGYVSPNIAPNNFSREGWYFGGWNTAANGTGVAVSAGAALSDLNFKDGEVVTLYAQWLPQYTITYVNNCSSWNVTVSTCSANSSNTSQQIINLDASGNGSATLGASNKFTLTGWKIKEWTTNASSSNPGTAYPVGTTFSVTGAQAGDGITLYAHWVKSAILNYNGNGADSGDTDGKMNNIKHTTVAEGDYVDLFAPNFQRAGYGFAGWSLTQTNTTSASDINAAVAAGTLKIYGPNETFYADSSYTSHIEGGAYVTLYAVWVAPESGVTMQTFDPTDTTYANMDNGSIIALADNRDNDVYMVAKLADGNWWMGENLRLDDSATLTTDNTHNPVVDGNNNVALTQAWFLTTSIKLASSSTADHLSSPLPNITTGNPYVNFTYWCSSSSANCIDQSMLTVWDTKHINTSTKSGYTYNYSPTASHSVTAATQASPAHSNLSSSVYGYGNHYNWYSATAGRGTQSKSSGHVAGDICPTGWHLPYGGASNLSGGFSYLDTQLESPDGSHGTGDAQSTVVASQRWRVYPNNFVYAGYQAVTVTSIGGPTDRGSRGRYWSTRASNTTRAYFTELTTSAIYPGVYNSTNNKYQGYSVRCVAGTYAF